MFLRPRHQTFETVKARQGRTATAALLGLFLCLWVATPSLPQPAQALGARLRQGQRLLAFEPNRGQAAPGVAYVAHGDGFSLLLAPSQATLVLAQPGAKPGPARASGLRAGPRVAARRPGSQLNLRLVGANAAAAAQAGATLPGKSHYLRGPDRSQWVKDVPQVGSVRFNGVYPGIDLKYYGCQRRLEYDFVLKPGADAGRIEWDVQGSAGLWVDGQGSLVLGTATGPMRFQAPVCRATGQAAPVQARYALRGGGRVGFQVSGWQGRGELVIDPVLNYATYLGGSGTDVGWAIAVDAVGDAFVTGNAANTFPTTPGAFQTAYGSGYDDAFVSKLDPSGSVLLYSTYLSGTVLDVGYAIAVDLSGCAYVTGQTEGGFPVTPGAFQTAYGGGGWNAFVAKLDPSGANLDYATYLGGSQGSEGFGITVDATGQAYVVGDTNGAFPTTPGAVQTVYGGGGATDGFVTKLSADGKALAYSTYLGGPSTDSASGVAVDAAGNAYVAGSTYGGFPVTPGAWQTSPGGGFDGFVVKLNPAGSAMVYSTLAGGAGDDTGIGVAVDAAGEAYLCGYTSGGFPATAGAFQTAYAGGQSDGFVVRLNASGSAALYATYVGGPAWDTCHSIALDGAGRAFLTGQAGPGFPVTAGALQTVYGGAVYTNLYLAVLSPGGEAMDYCTYYGAADNVFGSGVRLDAAGAAYLTGYVVGHYPTTAGAYQPNSAGADEAIIVKLVVPSITATQTASSTASPGPSPTQSLTPTPTASFSASPTSSLSATRTPSPGPSATASPTSTPTPSATATAPPASATPSPEPPLAPLLKPCGIYPNPFADKIHLCCLLSRPATLGLTVYDVAGEELGRWSAPGVAGPNEMVWDGVNRSGGRCASGAYIFRVTADGPDSTQGAYWARGAIIR